jgi:hypothetical protein
MTETPMDRYMRHYQAAVDRQRLDLRGRADDSAHRELERLVFMGQFLEMDGTWAIGLAPDGRVGVVCVA